jgi:DNA end-binding protein Ku
MLLEFSVPASRAFWKGYLKLSFVSCPVALYPATSAAERVSFRQVNRRTGHRLQHKLVDSVTGEPVDSSNKARGYEIGENEFLLVEDRDIELARAARREPGRSGASRAHAALKSADGACWRARAGCGRKRCRKLC